MPQKRRRLGRKMPLVEKRTRREHPLVQQWLALSAVAREVAASTKQQKQYVALLLQISELTQHDSSVPDNPWTGDQVDFEDVRNYVLSFLDDFDENVRELTSVRDNALSALKSADTQDDEALKSAAVVLTEAEFNLKKLDTFTNRWVRIVRYKTSQKVSMREHTDKWLTRWLRQWESTNANKSHQVLQFRETLAAVSRDSQASVLVQGRTQEPPSTHPTS